LHSSPLDWLGGTVDTAGLDAGRYSILTIEEGLESLSTFVIRFQEPRSGGVFVSLSTPPVTIV
jgi:hypothetical protein